MTKTTRRGFLEALCTGAALTLVPSLVLGARKTLEEQIEGTIKRRRRRGTIHSDERTAWLAYDIRSRRTLVSINADLPLQAASMIKPYVLLAYFHKRREGSLPYDPRSRKKLENMIRWSNNHNTNWAIDQVGGPEAVQDLLHHHYSHIVQHTDVVEKIPMQPGHRGQTYKNRSSASDYNRLLLAMWRNQLPYSREMLRIMALKGWKSRIFHSSRRTRVIAPAGTKVYNKTGSTAMCCGDMGILAPLGKDGKRYPYTIIGIIEKRKKAKHYSRWIRARGNVIREVSNIVYREMKRRHHLR